MMKFLVCTAGLLITVLLAACSPGVNYSFGNRITFTGDSMVIHVAGQPDAMVGRDGNLHIGDKSIAVTPEQRELLQKFYVQATGVMQSGKAVGKQGLSLAIDAVGNAIGSIFHRGSGNADKALDAKSNAIEAAASKVCADANALKATQNRIAEEIPAFKPYALHNRMITCTRTEHSLNVPVDGTSAPSR